MDRFRLQAGRLAQALGRTARGGTEQHPRTLRREDAQDRRDDRCLADARSAGHHENLRDQGQSHGHLLAVRQLKPSLSLDPGDRFVGIDRRPRRSSGPKHPETLSDRLLGPMQAAKKEALGGRDGIGDNRSRGDFLPECALNQGPRHVKQRLR